MTTVPGAAKLQANVNEVREKLEKLVGEAAYYMGLYHQAVPPEHRRGVSFSDRMFMIKMYTMLTCGHILIHMDTIWKELHHLELCNQVCPQLEI